MTLSCPALRGPPWVDNFNFFSREPEPTITRPARGNFLATSLQTLSAKAKFFSGSKRPAAKAIKSNWGYFFRKSFSGETIVFLIFSSSIFIGLISILFPAIFKQVSRKFLILVETTLILSALGNKNFAN